MKAALRNLLATFKWLFDALGRVAAQQPRAFVWGVVQVGLAKIFHVAAFVLPIKVVLLAGEGRVPRYLPFIDPNYRMEWIYGLAAASIISYGMTLLLERLSSRIANRAGTAISRNASGLAIVHNQSVEAQNIFTAFVEIAAGIIFYAVALTVIGLFDLRTFSVLLGLTLLSIAVAILLFIVPNRSALGPAKRFLVEHPDTYMAVNSSLIFLTSFLVILYPFLVGIDVNLFAAIISIIVLRRALSVIFGAVGDALKVLRKRHLVDALMFRDRHLQPKVEAASTSLVEIFSRKERRTGLLERVQGLYPDRGIRRMDWNDPTLPGINLFSLPGLRRNHALLQVFAPKRVQILDNETRLFDIVPRQALNAPVELGRLEIGDFVCRLLEIGRDLPDPGARPAFADALVDIAAVVPPPELVDVYHSTHPLLHERLVETSVLRADIAISGREQSRDFKDFRAKLPELRDRLAAIPLTISNPDAKLANARIDADGALRFMMWGRWTIEPVGGGQLAMLGPQAFSDTIAALAARRPDLSAATLDEDAILVRRVTRMLRELDGGKYGAALANMAMILHGESPRAEDDAEEDEAAMLELQGVR